MGAGGPSTNKARRKRKGYWGEPAVAPDRGGNTVFRGSTFHQPPRQVNAGVRETEMGRWLLHLNGKFETMDLQP
jgi:hypothetical protein